MSKVRVPKAWLEAGTKSKVKARVDMGEEVYGAGMCPVCQHQLQGPVFCSGKPMQVCMEDRVALPYPDEQHKQLMADYIPYEPEQQNYFGK